MKLSHHDKIGFLAIVVIILAVAIGVLFAEWREAEEQVRLFEAVATAWEQEAKRYIGLYEDAYYEWANAYEALARLRNPNMTPDQERKLLESIYRRD